MDLAIFQDRSFFFKLYTTLLSFTRWLTLYFRILFFTKLCLFNKGKWVLKEQKSEGEIEVPTGSVPEVQLWGTVADIQRGIEESGGKRK